MSMADRDGKIRGKRIGRGQRYCAHKAFFAAVGGTDETYRKRLTPV